MKSEMSSQWFEGKKIWVVRVDPGKDVLLEIEKFIKEKGIVQGMVIMGYGTLSQVRMHWVTHNKFPTNNLFETWEGGYELMSMNGMIVDSKAHIHFTGASDKGAFGGHLEEGCICYVLTEIGIIELDGPPMSKEMVSLAEDSEGKPVLKPQLRFAPYSD